MGYRDAVITCQRVNWGRDAEGAIYFFLMHEVLKCVEKSCVALAIYWLRNKVLIVSSWE